MCFDVLIVPQEPMKANILITKGGDGNPDNLMVINLVVSKRSNEFNKI